MAASTFGMRSERRADGLLAGGSGSFTLKSPRAPQSLIPLANSQLAGDTSSSGKARLGLRSFTPSSRSPSFDLVKLLSE